MHDDGHDEATTRDSPSTGITRRDAIRSLGTTLAAPLVGGLGCGSEDTPSEELDVAAQRCAIVDEPAAARLAKTLCGSRARSGRCRYRFPRSRGR